MTHKDSKALIITDHGKAVNYFGLTLYVPTEYNWIATDHGGGVWAFQNKPKNSKNEKFWSCETGNIIQIASIQECTGWKYSRIKVKHLEPITI